MRFDTIGVMKVLAVKDVEKYGNVWLVHYTHLTRRGVKKGAVFFCDTPDEARKKREELLDILKHHDGIYVSVKAKKKATTSRRKLAS
jgi:hypothetical protein